ncbi:MAG: sugar phosphate isomerase/epimerase family protein [Nitrososphaerales archaeon]
MYITLFENTVENFIDDLKMNIKDISVAEVVDFKTTALDNDLTIDSLKKVREVKFTVHCPFDPSSNISNPRGEQRKMALTRLKLSIDHAVDIGAVGFVQHPGSKLFAYDTRSEELNREALLELIDYSKARGLKLGIENMPPNVGYLSTPAEFDEFIKNNNVNVYIVFDTGHANMAGNIDEFVQKYASKFMQIHVTDNDGKSDGHLNVGEGTIDWKKLVNGCKKLGFIGPYVVESATDPFRSVDRLKHLIS